MVIYGIAITFDFFTVTLLSTKSNFQCRQVDDIRRLQNEGFDFPAKSTI